MNVHWDGEVHVKFRFYKNVIEKELLQLLFLWYNIDRYYTCADSHLSRAKINTKANRVHPSGAIS